ncbi:MAG: YceH family protein [Acidimicrobiales bacterium]
MRLSLEQGRVIGSLIEKQLTTPQQYPLSLNALVAACNQSSNRDPVVRYDDGTVQRALASLKDAGLVRFIYPSRGGSATRYRQVLDEYLGVGQEAVGLIAVLLLRGPQTAAELRSRTERMARLGGIAANAELERMANRPEPLVRRLARRPGQKEERWVQLLTPAAPAESYDSPARGTGADRAPEPESTTEEPEEASDDELPEPKGSALRALADEVNVLRAEVAALRAVVEQLQIDEASRRAAVEQIRARLSP